MATVGCTRSITTTGPHCTDLWAASEDFSVFCTYVALAAATGSITAMRPFATLLQTIAIVTSHAGTWLGSRVVSVLDSGAEEPWFKSQPRRCRATVLGILFTPIVPLFTKQRNW